MYSNASSYFSHSRINTHILNEFQPDSNTVTNLKQCKLYYSSSLNPLTPKSDSHLVSPYNITPKSHIKVTRIKEIIANLRSSRLLNKFSLSAS